LPVFFAAFFVFFCILPFCHFLQRFVASVAFTAFHAPFFRGCAPPIRIFALRVFFAVVFVFFRETAGS
jgi:hypothetical protein